MPRVHVSNGAGEPIWNTQTYYPANVIRIAAKRLALMAEAYESGVGFDPEWYDAERSVREMLLSTIKETEILRCHLRTAAENLGVEYPGPLPASEHRSDLQRACLAPQETLAPAGASA
jgi:hypothetical protein